MPRFRRHWLSLFADKLQHLDQAVLAKAIREARVAAKYPTPEIREILEAYHKAKRLDSSGWQPRAYDPPLPLVTWRRS